MQTLIERYYREMRVMQIEYQEEYVGNGDFHDNGLFMNLTVGHWRPDLSNRKETSMEMIFDSASSAENQLNNHADVPYINNPCTIFVDCAIVAQIISDTRARFGGGTTAWFCWLLRIWISIWRFVFHIENLIY